MADQYNEDSEISFLDLIGCSHLRSRKFHIDGLGKIAISELSSIDIASIRQQASKIPVDDHEQNSEFIARNACRFINGGKEPSVDELTAARKNLSDHVMAEIYKAGLTFNFADGGHREVIEKNS